MKLIIENIGTIKNADIELTDITVIAGDNDSGKSTVGKLMFSIIKAISKFKSELREDRERNIFEVVEKIYFRLRRRFEIRGEKVTENGQFRELFHPKYFQIEVIENGITAITDRIDFLKNTDKYNYVNDEFNELKNIVNQSPDKKESQKRAFTKIIYSEFKSDIVRKNSNGNGSVILQENNKDIVKIIFENNKLIEFNVLDELYIDDALFIETPMVLNMSETIYNANVVFNDDDTIKRSRFLGRANIAFHIKDLDNKLRESEYGNFLLEEIPLTKKITQIINGRIRYDTDEKDFIYYKDNEKHNILNVASGIKSFGIIQMLLYGGFLNEKTLLILDEPEVHLHPNWQIKYAELIAILAKENINILITTHSPYMVEALEKYSQSNNVKSNFYLTENNTIKSINNNDTLSRIFDKLAEPYDEFDKLDSEKL